MSDRAKNRSKAERKMNVGLKECEGEKGRRERDAKMGASDG